MVVHVVIDVSFCFIGILKLIFSFLMLMVLYLFGSDITYLARDRVYTYINLQEMTIHQVSNLDFQSTCFLSLNVFLILRISIVLSLVFLSLSKLLKSLQLR